MFRRHFFKALNLFKRSNNLLFYIPKQFPKYQVNGLKPSQFTTGISVGGTLCIGLCTFASCQSNNDVTEVTVDTTSSKEAKNVAVNNYPASAEEVKNYIRKAFRAIEEKKFEDAEKLYHDAMDFIMSCRNDESWNSQQLLRATIYVYSCMGNLYMRMGYLQRAEGLFIECIRGLMEDGKQTTDDAVIELSLKIAVIKASMGRHEDAEIGYQFCVDSQQKKVQEMTKSDDSTAETEVVNSHALLGKCLHAYSKWLAERGRHDDAVRHMTQCVGLGESVLPADHLQRAVLYNDLGQMLASVGRYTDSISYIEKALAISQANSVDRPVFLDNLAVAHALMGDFVKAEKYCGQISYLAKKFKSTDVEQVAENCKIKIKELKEKKK